MKRRNRLRNRLVAAYLVATVLPVGLTVWTGIELLDRSIRAAPVLELDETSRALESLGREYYQHARQTLARDAASGRVPATVYLTTGRERWPAPIAEFWASSEPQRFQTAGPDGQTLQYMERRGASVRLYSLDLGIGMSRIAEQFAAARATVARAQPKNLRRGFFYTLAIVSSAIWVAGLAFLIYWANRLSGPVQRLARGLSAVAGGDLASRIPVDRDDEIGAATAAFNDMADQLQQSRDRLVHVTRLASWQALARKTAHEVKNSLTPIRLTMEEIIARRVGNEDEFLRQAAQIVVDEVMSLERRVRAFSELASEPPVSPEPIDVNAAVEERIALLRAAHPGVAYETRLDAARPIATADPDLIKGVLTNLLENAAEAARAGGIVRVKTAPAKDRVLVEIHDSGPGLSVQARSSIFEPTISFKKNGMGLGLSIARKSALMCGGDLSVIDGELGGAAFRISLQGGRIEIARAG